MTLEELTARLEAIDKELLPLFAKQGRSAEECRQVAKLEAEYETTKGKLNRMRIAERLAAKKKVE